MDRAIISLDGTWRLARYGAAEESPGASLDSGCGLDPGHRPWLSPPDLVAAGKLANPLAGSAAARDSDWVARANWLYATEFDAAAGHR